MSKGEWKEFRFSDLMEIIGGGTPKTTVPEYWGGNIPWLSVQDFNNGKKYCFDAEKKITEKGLKESSTKILKKGQIIISARGTVGVISMLGKDMAFNQSNYGINAKSVLTENQFLYYLLKHNIDNFISNSYGAVFDTITKETFDQIIVLIPEIPEQQSIASILSSLDDKIDLLHRQNKTLEALAETLFRKWFVEEADEKINFIKLGDVVQTTSGGTPSRDNPEFFVNGIYNWVKSKELQGTFIFDTEELITEKALSNSSAKLVPENSILIALYGATVGEYAILSKQATCNQAVCALIPNEDYPYTYLFNLVKQNKENLINLAVGSAQQNISQLLIKDLEISSDKKLIQKYHLEVNAIFEKIKSNIIQIRTLTQLRDTLLPKLMSGEVRVLI
ncbi:MAG: restriction endonuclease subunit S [Ignavibacterium sp.]|nr:restriction endonuclease subunit S [Ignavibacterium sp.]